jgi:hypothetical protein
MLTGRFGAASGRPYIEGRIHFPRLKVHGDVSFLLDTGADHSVLMPSDAIRLNVPFDNLRGDMPATGVGGEMHFYQESALLVFSDPGSTGLLNSARATYGRVRRAKFDAFALIAA